MKFLLTFIPNEKFPCVCLQFGLIRGTFFPFGNLESLNCQEIPPVHFCLLLLNTLRANSSPREIFF